MSAEMLRKAAALMRERAEGAVVSCSDNVPEWYTVGGLAHPDLASEADAAHIASWRPAVALAVADLLDEYARLWVSSGTHSGMRAAPTGRHYLAVAAAYLGDSACPPSCIHPGQSCHPGHDNPCPFLAGGEGG